MKPHYDIGKYRGKVVQQALSPAGTGTPQFVVRFTVLVKIDQAGEILDCEQYDRTVYRAITEKTMPYLLEDLEAIGYDRESFKFLDPSVDNHFDIVGQEFDFYCSHQPGQGGQGLKEQWGFAKAGGGQAEIKPLESKQIRDLDNLYGKQLKELRKKKPTVPMAPKQAASVGAATNDDGDLPF